MGKIPVTVYTKSNCVQCDQTKKKFNQLGIEYSEVNLEENPEKVQEFMDQGLMSAPIVVAGLQTWAGFRLDRIAAMEHTIKSSER